MTKAIEILEQEIKELQKAVKKLREKEPWRCEVTIKTKPVEQKTIDISQVKELQVKGVKYKGVTYLTAPFKNAYVDDDHNLIIEV